jgi:integrase/recombinase XerD
LCPIGSEDEEQLMASGDGLTQEEVLAVFDEHLRRTRGVCVGTRRTYARFVRAFLVTVFADGRSKVAVIHARDVVGFVGGLTGRYRPRAVELGASSLRSFFRFLHAAGLRADRLGDAVPMIPHRPAGLVRHLDPGRFAELTASLDSSSPRGLRDRAIILCLARLGLRASEVVDPRLEDLGWRSATVRVRARKTGHGALLPLPGEVGAALADYLQHGRPGHAGAPGVRAGPYPARRAGQQQRRRQCREQRAAAGGHGRAGARG